MEAYGDGYMAPEEEWEREGLLDPAWEKQQKKVSECHRVQQIFPFIFRLFSLNRDSLPKMFSHRFYF